MIQSMHFVCREYTELRDCQKILKVFPAIIRNGNMNYIRAPYVIYDSYAMIAP